MGEVLCMRGRNLIHFRGLNSPAQGVVSRIRLVTFRLVNFIGHFLNPSQDGYFLFVILRSMGELALFFFKIGCVAAYEAQIIEWLFQICQA